MINDTLIAYAHAIRTQRQSGATNLEQACAPAFKALLDAVLPLIAPGAALVVVPEYASPGIGRPDIALKRPGEPARAFIEMKAPTKPANPAQFKDAHDKRQFQAFKALPVWGLSNFASLRVYRLGDEIADVRIVPDAALDPTTTDKKAGALIAAQGGDALLNALLPLALVTPPSAANAKELAANLARAARLVRAIVEQRLAELKAANITSNALQQVRDEFREVLYAHPQAGGYTSADFETLFAAAFAQTLAFGLLLVREATGKPVHPGSWNDMPVQHPLMRTTLRVLSQEEIVAEVGVGFEVIIDTVNSFDASLIARKPGRPDPILYFYEDFLQVFDPVAREKYGVYYTPVEVVAYMAAALDGALKDHLGTGGLVDPGVTILDPATGTGTFLLGIIERVRAETEAVSPGMVPGALRGLAGRLYGLELLVGPYAVAHYRLHHALGSLHANERVGVYLADTLAEPGAAAPMGSLGFVAENIRSERIEADRVKARQPILAIIGNPPYKRLAAGEIGELVGGWMDGLWDDLKAPVRDAGWANQLNTFPELSVAFWRWAMWKMFESDGAPQRGVIAMITNRTFLAGKPYAGLRAMLRQRFDRIEVIDLRGDLRRGARAGVEGDVGVFNIQVGTAITLAIADGSKAERTLAEVRYTDMWKLVLFDRKAKLGALANAAATHIPFDGVIIPGEPLGDWKPLPFGNYSLSSIHDCFDFRVSGIQSKRDGFAYAFNEEQIIERMQAFKDMPAAEAALAFHNSRDRKWPLAQLQSFDNGLVKPIIYRPLDRRVLYNSKHFVDFGRPELQAVWGSSNTCLYVMPSSTGAGPAVWCHGLLPDYHAFRGSYGGYAFPLYDRRPGRTHNITPTLLTGLALAYGRAVAPAEVFDAILALLSATSYSLRFAEDLEDVFPHVPFPADVTVFDAAVALGAQIRAIETFASAPGAPFDAVTRIDTAPTGPLAASDWTDGGFFLCADGSGQVSNVPHAVWTFAVSGYRLLPRWLDHRRGQPCDLGLMTAMRDVAARIARLIPLFDAGDAILAAAVDNSLTKAQLGLAPAPAMPHLGDDGESD